MLPDIDSRPRRSSRSGVSTTRLFGGWLLSFLGFPLGGLPAIALGGVDSWPVALVGGAGAGLVIGAAQGLAIRRALPGTLTAWTVATCAGLAGGLVAGAAAVEYGTGAGDLVVQGLLSGLGVGLAQGYVLHRVLGTRAAVLWAAAATVLWPAGWTVTRLAGVSVGDHFAVFGATGAVAYSAASGVLLLLITARVRASRVDRHGG